MAEKEPKCVIKGCKNKRYKNHLFCENHWKERRKQTNYKEDD